MSWDCRMQSPTKLRSLGDSEGEEEAAKEEDPLPPLKVGDSFGKNLSKK